MAVGAALHDAFVASARRTPGAVAVVEPGRGTITYGELDALSDRVRDRLAALGVDRGDRVGIYLRKSIDSVATLLGALKAGAAYVPVDPGAPATRGAYILHNCGVKVVVVEAALADKLGAELQNLGAAPAMIAVDGPPDGGAGLRAALDAADAEAKAPPVATVPSKPSDLAYILYTSGSTGKPKGVMLSHENAVSFVDWCSESFEPTAADRFSSHAPFHFDLSILDIHVCLKHGATLVLIGEDIGKDAPRLAALIADERISIWYSAPSILALLAQFGNLATHDYSRVAPGAVRRRGVSRQASARAVDCSGPHRATSISTARPRPTSAPTTKSGCRFRRSAARRTRSATSARTCAAAWSTSTVPTWPHGSEGELCIAGPGVMQGYWALPEQTAKGFFVAADGTRWYRTGDIVTEDAGRLLHVPRPARPDGQAPRLSRRARRNRGRACTAIPASRRRPSSPSPTSRPASSIAAFLSCREAKRPSLIEIKRFCAENLPLYMIPDRFVWLDSLPKTSTDKIDYQRLKEMR